MGIIKTNIMKISIFFTIIVLSTLILHAACSKKSSNTNKPEELEKVLYENNTPWSGNLYENQVSQNSLLSKKHDIVANLFNSKEWEKINAEIKNKINYSEIRRTKYNHTKVEILELPIHSITVDESLFIFYLSNKFKIIKANQISLNGNKKRLSFLTINNESILSFDYNDQMQILGVTTNESNSLRNLLSEISDQSKQLSTKNIVSSNTARTEQTCPESTSTFGSCMTCAINECANDFPCNITCAIWTKSCLAGFAIGCAIN